MLKSNINAKKTTIIVINKVIMHAYLTLHNEETHQVIEFRYI